MTNAKRVRLVLSPGFVIEFVSMPVTGGFTSAAAIIMASSQLKGLFGISYEAKNCMEMWLKFAENIDKVRVTDTAMGVVCVAVLIGLKVSRARGLGRKACATTQVLR